MKIFELYKVAKNDNLDGIEIVYKEAAENGSLNANIKLAYCYQKGIEVKVNKVKAFNLYKEAAENKNSIAQYNLGHCYRFGVGIEKDEDKAFKLYKEAAKKKNGVAQNSLGILYEKGIGTEINLKKLFIDIIKQQKIKMNWHNTILVNVIDLK